MASRVELVPVEASLRLGADIGIGEAQASRGAFRMLANHPDLARHVFFATAGSLSGNFTRWLPLATTLDISAE